MLCIDRLLVDGWNMGAWWILKKMDKSSMTQLCDPGFWKIGVMFLQIWKTETKSCMTLPGLP